MRGKAEPSFYSATASKGGPGSQAIELNWPGRLLAEFPQRGGRGGKGSRPARGRRVDQLAEFA